jgi:hypothetical protein
MTLKPVYTVNGFLADFGMGRTRFYELVATGEIKVRKNGNRTIIIGDDAKAWLDSLPVVQPSMAA